MDRRRPRRQPVRDRRRAAHGDRAGQALTALDHHLGDAAPAVDRSCRSRIALVTPTAGAAGAGRRRRATTRRSAPTSRTGGRCGACTPASTRSPPTLLGPAAAGELTVPPPPVARPAVRSVDELVADLGVVSASLPVHGVGGARGGRRRAGAARRGDVRHPPVRARHAPERDRPPEVVVAELLAVAGVCDGYLELDEAARLAVLQRRAALAPPAAHPVRHLQRAARPGELAVLDAAAVAVDRLGAGAIPHYVISGAESASDVLEVAVLLREVGLVRPAQTPPSAIDIVPLFETIDDLQRGHEVLADAARRPAVRRARRRPRRPPGGDDRVLRLQQGRRLPDRQLGAVGGPGGARRRRPGRGRAAAPVPRSRRHRRARRRTGLRGDPGPAAGLGRRPAADHRAGRDGGRQVQPAGVGPAQPRDPRRRHARGVGRRRRPTSATRPSRSTPR